MAAMINFFSGLLSVGLWCVTGAGVVCLSGALAAAEDNGWPAWTVVLVLACVVATCLAAYGAWSLWP